MKFNIKHEQQSGDVVIVLVTETVQYRSGMIKLT